MFQGVSVYITVWDRDAEGLFVDFDMVDEFSFDFVAPAGDRVERCYDGLRYDPKSRCVAQCTTAELL